MSEDEDVDVLDETMWWSEREIAKREAELEREIRAAEKVLAARRAKRKRRLELREVRLAVKEARLQKLRRQIEMTAELADDPWDEINPTRTGEELLTTLTLESEIAREIAITVEESRPIIASQRQTETEGIPMCHEREQIENQTVKVVPRPRTMATSGEEKAPGETTDQETKEDWYWRKRGAKGRFIRKKEQPEPTPETQKRGTIVGRTTVISPSQPPVPFAIRRLTMRRLKRGGPGPTIAPRQTSQKEEIVGKNGQKRRQTRRASPVATPSVNVENNDGGRGGQRPEQRRGSTQRVVANAWLFLILLVILILILLVERRQGKGIKNDPGQSRQGGDL